MFFRHVLTLITLDFCINVQSSSQTKDIHYWAKAARSAMPFGLISF